jgi:2-phospho-L-lactate/phosphoenolpyruvate guanylyltransferase
MVTHGIVAIIPIRSFAEGKTRLINVLSPSQRRALIEEMFATVISAVRQSGSIARIGVVSPDPEVLAAVDALGDQFTAIRQDASRPGLNEAANIGREWAESLGAGAMLMLFGDLPLLTPADVQSLVRRDAPVVIATDRHGLGTNGIVLRLGGSTGGHGFRFSYGPNSRQRHVDEADRLGMEVITAIGTGTAFDLDTIDDLERLGQTEGHLPAAVRSIDRLSREQSA